MCVLESSLSGKTHPSTPAMYKFRPSFGTMPKVHYHAAGEKVRYDLSSIYELHFKCSIIISFTLIAGCSLPGRKATVAAVKERDFLHISVIFDVLTC